jgi:hypothetical protein
MHRTHIREPNMASTFNVRLCRRLPYEDAGGHGRKWEKW